MDVLFFLVPIALFLAGLFVVAFRWATRNDQFDDLNTPALRILLDDDERPSPHPNRNEPPTGKPDALT